MKPSPILPETRFGDINPLKQAALIEDLGAAKADRGQWASAAWMVYFLAGGKPRQTVPTRLLWRLAIEGSGLPLAMRKSSSSSAITDETLAPLLPEGEAGDGSADVWMRQPFLRCRRSTGGTLRGPAAMGG